MILLREGKVDVAVFANLHTNNLLLKSGNESTGTDAQRVFFSFSTIKRNTVFESFVIDDCGIAHGNRAFFVHACRVAG